MEVTGKVIDILEMEKGVSKNNTAWAKQNVILETEGEYPKKICVTGVGKIVDSMDTIKIGDKLTAHVNLESREYEGRWYSEIKMWKFNKN